MINVGKKIVNNDLQPNDVVTSVTVEKTCENDIEKIIETLAKGFELTREEVFRQFVNSKILINESVKLVDKNTNDIYGLLTLCEYPIMFGSPIMEVERGIGEYLSQYKQVNGHSFVIDKRLRGSGFDKEMLYKNLSYLTDNYDFIWIGVEKDLKSHNYWKKLGFVEIFSIDEATFYILPLSKRFVEDIYKK